MKVFVTGATGFIGSRVAQQLRARGDEVRALVRSRPRGAALAAAGCELIEGTVTDESAVSLGLRDCDAVVHGAAIYEIGVPAARRAAIFDTNVGGTKTVLGAALRAGTQRALYVSSVVVYGNTHGAVVDETSPRRDTTFTSVYEESKVRSHEVAERLIAQGLPGIIVQPGGVYGPDDHSQIGNMITLFLRGRLPLQMFPGFGVTAVHRDDVADGIVRALHDGHMGDRYILGGDNTTLGEIISTVAELAGKRAPRFTVPAPMMRMSAPLGPMVGPVLGFPPNLREAIATIDGVTFWASSSKAERELGYHYRPLRDGLHDTLAAEGRLPATA